jgi:hypothetical protein
MDQAQAFLLAQLRHHRATLYGCGDTTLEKSVVDHFLGIEAPHPATNLRLGTKCSPCQRPAVGGNDIDRIAGTRAAIQTVDRAGKNPRVAVCKRTILAGQKNELGHVGFAKKLATSSMSVGQECHLLYYTLFACPVQVRQLLFRTLLVSIRSQLHAKGKLFNLIRT